MRIPPFHPPFAKTDIDYMSEGGAHQLARIIEDAWADAGHPNVTAEPVKRVGWTNMSAAVWGVKTNLVNGLPPAVVQPRRAKRARVA